jgi:hypothetical protein
MARFVTIGYGDEAGYERTAQQVKDRAHGVDEAMREAGAVSGVAGKPVQVRNHGDAGTTTEDGSFMSSGLPVAGFGLIEAADLDAAIAMVAGTPCAVAYGVVEVWPLDE